MELDKLSTSQIREASRDIEEIYQVAKKSSSAVIQSHVVNYIEDFRAKLLAASKEYVENLRLKVRFPDGLVAILANLSPTMSLGDLKSQIEESKDGPFQLLKLHLVRTNVDITGFDGTSLVGAGVCNNDVFVAEGNCSELTSMSVQQPSSPPAFEILASSNLQYSCSEEVFFVGLHCCLLEEGMICIVEMPNSVPGFAPSLKELPKTKLLPDGWNRDPTSMSTLYKHKAYPGKKISLMCVTMGEDFVVVSLSLTSKQSFNMELTPSQFVNDPRSGSGSEGADPFCDPQGLREKVTDLLLKLFPNHVKPSSGAKKTGDAAPTSSSDPSRGNNPTRPPSYPSYPSYPAPSPYPVSPRMPDVGSGDLHPFPSPNIGPYPHPVGGTGSLVGPNHPIFGPTPGLGEFPGGMGGGPFPGLGPIPGLPQPRFDPFGPVPGPLGPDFGPMGGGRGGRRGGRGRGRGVPGEPNPDHLAPPGWEEDDDMFT